MKKAVFFTILISLFTSSFPVFSETAEPYKQDEFPGILHDIRRAEIITLGSMPFITFSVTLGYSFGKYAAHDFDSSYFVNPFSSTDENSFSTDEQIGILLTSLGISAGIGLTDFIVHTVKRNNRLRRLKKQKNTEIQINPVFEDPDAIKIEPPKNDEEIENSETNDFENQESKENKENIESPQEFSSEKKKNIKTGKKLNVITEE